MNGGYTITPGTTGPIDVMLDIETAGTRPGCPVLSVGLCSFGPRIQPRATLALMLDLDEQMRRGLHADAPTLLWWLRQSDAARDALCRGQDTSTPVEAGLHAITAALASLRVAAGGAGLRIWALGASFDAPVLGRVFVAFRFPPPWDHRELRCARTLFDLAGINRKAFPPAIAHDALSDAIAQADAAEAALATLANRGVNSGEEPGLTAEYEATDRAILGGDDA